MFNQQLDKFLNDKVSDYWEIWKDVWRKDV